MRRTRWLTLKPIKKSGVLRVASFDSNPPFGFVDAKSKQIEGLDVDYAKAIAARVLAVTQLMETFSSREVQNADSVDLKHLANTAVLLLRDGCDVLDVLGWRLRPV